MRRRNKLKWRILFISAFFTIISLPRLNNLIRQQRQYKYYITEVTKLEEDNEKLLSYIESLQNDPYFTEKLLRDNFGYVKEGESVYRIKNQEGIKRYEKGE